MDTTRVIITVSLAMFFEFAIWGAWMPVLAGRLTGPLKMTGRQSAMIYATLTFASMISPVIGGYIGDKFVDPKWLLIVLHAVGALLLFVAAKTEQFGKLFRIMLLYSFCYAVTIPMVNTVLFANEAAMKASGFDIGCLFTLFGVKVGFVGFVFLWAPVAWAIAGYGLSFWRAKKGVGDGSDCLKLAAWMSVLMVVSCCFLGGTPKSEAAGVVAETTRSIGGFLAQPEVYLFLLVQFLVVGVQQFYFMGTGSFLTSSGKVQEKSISAIMATAQVVQALATLFLLGKMGNQTTLIIGTLCWSMLFAVYILGRPIGLMIPIQAFHGLAYVFFVIAGQNYINVLEGAYSQGAMQATAQGILLVVTNGFGLFLGTWLAGRMLDAARDSEGSIAWPKVWCVPLLLTLVGAAIFFASPFVEAAPAEPVCEDPTCVVGVEADVTAVSGATTPVEEPAPAPETPVEEP
ncbi:MAG: MFS transporter, partial [Planctomycetia bacterium]|nr:MFS transporter [Planctomycetia bacterium]